MMKKIAGFLGILVLLLALTSCAKAPTWEEQYDLGVRYLSEGNYEEAILAFTAAIEIDPKRAPAYVGRGDAYIGSGETAEHLSSAQADYEEALSLDEGDAEIYLKLADVYIRQGDTEKALELLQKGLDITGDPRLQEQLDQLTPQEEDDTSETVTVVGYIIDNSEEYHDTWERYIEQYQNQDEEIYCSILTCGVRFESSVDARFSDGARSIQEAAALYDASVSGNPTVPWESDPQILGRRMELTGYFVPRDQPGEITGPEAEEGQEGLYYTYWPNGDYYFFVQACTPLD